MEIVKSNRFKIFILFSLLLSLIQCAGGLSSLKKAKYPQEITDAIQSDFNAVESMYRQQHYDEALSAYQKFIVSYNYNQLTDEAQYKIGKIFFLRDQSAQAHEQFLSLAQKSPDASYKAKGLFMAGYASFKSGNYQQALDELDKVKEENLDAKLKIQALSLMYSSADVLPGDEIRPYLYVLRLYDVYEESFDDSLRSLHAPNVIDYDKTKSLIDNFVVAPLSVVQIPTWLLKYPHKPARAFVEYKLGKTYYEAGDNKKASIHLTRFVQTYPKNQYSDLANQILNKVGVSNLNESDENETLSKGEYKVGLLVPLSGDNAKYGSEVIDGVRCGAGEGSVCNNHSGAQLLIEDSGDSPETLRAALDRLQNAHVSAIIGPMTGPLAVEAGAIATAKRIPIFPITQKSHLMQQGNYVFQIGYTAEQQMKDLVSAAMNEGHRSFGIFYPNNNYGQVMSNLFNQEVVNKGGKITAIASYTPGKDVMSDAQRLEQVSREGNSYRYDALFIPDSYEGVNEIISGLQYVGISGVPLLGTIAWNDPKLATAIISNKYPGSFIVGFFDVEGRSAQDFVMKFRSSFGRQPTVLSALGYDTMTFIQKAVEKNGADKIQETLGNQLGIEGITGLKGFESGVGPILDTKIMRITDAGIRE